MEVFGIIDSIVTIPSNYELVEAEEQIRNGVMVKIYRYQENGKFELNGPRIIAIFEEENLISLKNLSSVPIGEMLEDNDAVMFAEEIIEKANIDYGTGLVFLREEYQEREFNTKDGMEERFPVQWIKFVSCTGNYSWVTLGANGKIVEIEYESEWDYFRGRRKTEMWDNDDWVLAYYGQGPQLPSPNALA